MATLPIGIDLATGPDSSALVLLAATAADPDVTCLRCFRLGQGRVCSRCIGQFALIHIAFAVDATRFIDGLAKTRELIRKHFALTPGLFSADL